MEDGTLWACGHNEYGILGDGTTTNHNKFKLVMDGVAQVAAGYNHTMILKEDGTLWACGNNDYGQLGDGSKTARSIPKQIMSDVASVAAGGRHTLILKSDGTLWACGYNNNGQLGDGTTTDRSSPKKMTDDVAKIAAGITHTLFIKTDGTLWGVGSDDFGALAQASILSSTTYITYPKQLMVGVADVAAGNNYTEILKVDGTLWACGDGGYGGLGTGSTATYNKTPKQVTSNVSKVSVFSNHTMILKRDGSLWACGWNYKGALGDGTTTNRSTPVQVMTDVSDVSAGGLHTIIVKKDGTTWTCGLNEYGGLGDGTNTDRYTPVNIEIDILVDSVTLNKTTLSLQAGQEEMLIATVKPDNAKDKTVTWTSSNASVATVDNDGKVTAISSGSATITCSSNDGSGVTATCTVTVIDPNAIDITSTNFPDENFRNWLLEQDYGKDGKLTENEIKNVTSISVNGKKISILKGIEYFTNLDRLYCYSNQLTSLDVSKNTALTTLDCSSNQLTSLDVSNCTALTTLDCPYNQLTSLDVSKNMALTMLVCYFNQLTSLDVSNCTALTKLSCISNQLSSLDVSNCMALKELYCYSNQLTSLDVSKNTALTTLYCQRNQIKGASMDAFIQSLPNMSTNPKFVLIDNREDDEGNVCTKSQVAAAKAKGWTPLYNNGSEWVEYEGSEDSNAIEINSTNFPDDNFRNWLLGQDYGKDGKLTEDEIKNITSISVSNKNISTLKGIEFFTSLIELQCWSNQLTSLDVSKNTALTWLSCYSNQLTSLDVSKNTALTQLDCYYNQLTTLDVSKNTALKYMQCGANQLISLDVSNTALTRFNCHLNQIKGKAMDELINSLPYNSSDEIYKFQVISLSYDEEGNICTKNQVAAAKAKGWTPYCFVVGSGWLEYEGSDEYQYAKGDVNMDNAVNGTDLVALSNIVLGRKEKTETADVNGDGNVNGTDIVALSNIILGRSNKASRRTSASGASLSIEDFDIKAGETKEMLIDLSNPNDEVTLVQFDLHLPAGLSIKKSGSDLDFDMAGRTSWRKHTLDANEVDGAYRFLLYSSGNTLIEDTSGAIIKVNIVADESFNGGKIVLDNILLVDPNEKETKPEAYEYVIPTPEDGSAKLSIEPFDIAVGETKEMLIDLSNPNDEVTLVQFDLHLPAGLSIKKSGSDLDFDMAERTSWRKHTLDANEVDGAYRFLLYSSGNTLIEGTNGAIIKVNLVADESFNGGKIVLDNILLVDPNEKETKPANYEYEIGSGSGISTVMMDASGKNTRIYNLSGQKLTAPKKGVNIINGKKIVIR